MMTKTKKLMLFILCAVVLISSLSFVACDKDSMHDISKFYGEYDLPYTKYFNVTYNCLSNSDRSISESIIGVKERSYVCVNKNVSDSPTYEYIQKDFDTRLLAELDKVLEFMGDHIELKKESVYFSDSRQSLKFNAGKSYWMNDVYIFSGDFKPEDYEKKIGYAYFETENYTSYKNRKKIQIVQVFVPEIKVTALDGTEWNLYVSRQYKRYC